MKKFIGIFLCFLFMSSISFGANFQPIIMTLTAPSEIHYDFGGSQLNIPFNVEGTPAAVWLVINTKGKAENIAGIRNGFLGWHYVNKIDTTVFVSDRNQVSKGENSIVWDGTNQDGGYVTPGEYTYYLWAYNDYSQKKLVSDYVIYDLWGYHLYEAGTDGLPLAKPFFSGKNFLYQYKWVI